MTPQAPLYERVTYRPRAGRARTIYLHRPAVAHTDTLGDVLIGVEVDRHGDDVSGAKFDERRHVIALDAVVRRVAMRMDFEYAELVEVV